MKNSTVVYLGLFLLSLTQVNAQFGRNNGYGNNGYGNGAYGSGRMNQNNLIQDTPEKPKEIPTDVTVAEIIKKLKPELNLDALQEIAIGQIIKENIRNQSIILKDEKTGQDQKLIELEALSENINRRINELLNPEQREKYKKLTKKNGTKLK